VTEMPEEAMHGDLRSLQAAEFASETYAPTAPVYTCKHVLTQEVAYHSLVRWARQRYHTRIAQVLEAQFQDVAQAQPALLAYHYTEAGLAAQAVPYWLRAGERAVERVANVEAISHLRKGLEAVKSLPASPECIQQELTLQIALGAQLLTIKGHTAPEAEHAYARAQELSQQVEDSPQRFSVLVGLWMFALNRARLQTARELAEQCVTLAQHLHDQPLHQEAYRMLGITLFHIGKFVPARQYLEQETTLYAPQLSSAPALVRSIHPGISNLSYLSRTLWKLGYPNRALATINEALTLAQKLSYTYSLGLVLQFAALLHRCRGEVQLAQERAEAMVTLAQEREFARWLGGGLLLRGWALAVQGSIEEGMEQLSQGVAAWRSMGGELAMPSNLAILAEVYGKAGRAEEGLHAVAEGLAIAHRTGERRFEAELYRLKGELLLQQAAGRGSAHSEVEACFLQAIDTARRQHARSWELRAAMSLSRLWQVQGKRVEARQLLAEIYDWFTEGFETLDLREAKALLLALQ